MKKAVLILLSLILLVFSGCSKSEDVSSSEIVPDAKIENLERAFESYDGSLAVAMKDGKLGYISKDGKWYISPSFESASDFSFGAAAVSVIDEERGELFGYISSNGEYIEFLHPEFTSAGDFSKKGLAKVTENKGEYFYINKEGTIAFKNRIIDFGDNYYEEYINAFNYATDFENGYALVGETNPETNEIEYYIISEDGELSYKFDKKYYSDDVFAIAYSKADENGYCIVIESENNVLKFGVIDLSGNVIIESKYEEIRPYSDGMFAVKHSGKWGFVDNKGEIIIDFKFADVRSFEKGSAPVSNGKKWGIIDKEGKWVIKPSFEKISENGFSEGILSYSKKGKWGYVSYLGEIVTEAVFKEAYDFSAGAAKIADANGLYGYINRSGKVIIEPGFETANDFHYIDE